MLSGACVRLSPQNGALSAALRAAEPNTTIVLSPGTYVERDGLICDVEGVSIVGFDGVDSNGQPMSTIMGDLALFNERPFLQISSTRFLAQNIKIDVSFSSSLLLENPMSSDHSSCVLISKSSEAVFDHCCVTSQKHLVGFTIQHYSRPCIRFCEISNNKW